MRKTLIGISIFIAINSHSWDACRAKVYNRGRAPVSYLDESLAWSLIAPDEIFAPNNNYDIYNLIKPYLGPWHSVKHRKAALLDLMRVSAAYESSFNWLEGRDLSANNTSPCTTEAGIYQTSGNVLANFGGDLVTLFAVDCNKYSGSRCVAFQKCTKGFHNFAMETHARLLRHTNGYKHYGPILRGDVFGWLSRACVAEFEGKL